MSSGDLTTRILVEIRDELRQHGVLLTSLDQRVGRLESTVAQHTVILAQHTKILDRHTEILERHTELLGGHSAILGRHEQTFGQISVTLTQILRAIEHGNARRDDRVEDHEHRIRRLETRTGLES